jgi:hypothetical protein
MKRLLVNIKSSLLLKTIYECSKHYNYLQTDLHLIETNLQASKLLKHVRTDTKLLKMPSSLKFRLN